MYFLTDDRITFKAKGLLAYLLSLDDSFDSHATSIKTIMKSSRESDSAIRSGVAELVEAGYLVRLQYVQKSTRRIAGSLWYWSAYPRNDDFLITQALDALDNHEMDVFSLL